MDYVHMCMMVQSVLRAPPAPCLLLSCRYCCRRQPLLDLLLLCLLLIPPPMKLALRLLLLLWAAAAASQPQLLATTSLMAFARYVQPFSFRPAIEMRPSYNHPGSMQQWWGQGQGGWYEACSHAGIST